MKNTLIILVVFNCLFTAFLIFEINSRSNDIENLKIDNLKPYGV